MFTGMFKFHQSSYFVKLHILLFYKLSVFTSGLVKSNIIIWGIFIAKGRTEKKAILEQFNNGVASESNNEDS